jgi:hypothetical protein
MQTKMNHVRLSLLSLFICCCCHAQDTTDIAAVRQACFNYIDAFYKADTALAHASVHPTLQKRGFAYDKAKSAYSAQLEMPYPALMRLATTWNKDGSQANAQSPRSVHLFEVADKTATAKVTAAWGIDYLHLIKESGRWYIVNVLWQSPPLSVTRPGS